jgi:hypothetical protein
MYHWPEEDDLALVFQQTEEFQRIGFGRPPFVTARTLPKSGHHHVIHPETHTRRHTGTTKTPFLFDQQITGEDPGERREKKPPTLSSR